ncbi:hypothetical protein DdX_13381 [Ditylenchus destructor]|uniref:Uncharacterized protein n=1 Tax=Ditylenchus destructor TaxID=166010 RepID=A0AAD4MWN4_9BILA|nr:hypothetical protein DdX_13381 [Ditylenchus destructor]
MMMGQQKRGCLNIGSDSWAAAAVEEMSGTQTHMGAPQPPPHNSLTSARVELLVVAVVVKQFTRNLIGASMQPMHENSG